MEPLEFVEGLVRLAYWRYTTGSLSKRFLKMFKEEVLPNACLVDTDVFRDRLGSDDVVDMFDRRRYNLKTIYDVYAADDDSDEASQFLTSMNSTELDTFCTEVGLIGPMLSHRAVRVIFAYVQQEEELLEGDDVSDEIGGDNEMVYTEFKEACGAIGSWMEPDPYLTMAMRIDRFLLRKMFPACIAMPRFKFKKLRRYTELGGED